MRIHRQAQAPLLRRQPIHRLYCYRFSIEYCILFYYQISYYQFIAVEIAPMILGVKIAAKYWILFGMMRIRCHSDNQSTLLNIQVNRLVLSLMENSKLPMLTEDRSYLILDYLHFVKQPMDLGTIRKQLLGYNIQSKSEFVEHMRLIFSNSGKYNTNTRSRVG